MENVTTNRFYSLLTFGFIFLVYAFTSSQYVCLEDDGLFIMASYFGGVSHPPGYPVYTILGKLVTFLPIGTVAYRVHLLSAFFGAASCVICFLIVRYISGRVFISFCTSIILAFSKTFWSQSIVAEIYSLNVFLFLLVIYLLISLDSSSIDTVIKRRLYWVFLIIGLGCSNHWPLFVLSSPAFAVLLYRYRGYVFVLWWKLFFAFFLGLLPYAWLFIVSNDHSGISFYGAIDSWEKFFFYVSRKGYSSVDNNQVAGLSDKINYLFFFFKQLWEQFSIPLFIVGMFGFCYSWKKFEIKVALSLLFGFLGSSFLLILLLNFEYNQIFKAVFRVYPLLAFSVFVIWIFAGFEFVQITIKRFYMGEKKLYGIEKATIICNSFAVLVCIYVFVNNWNYNNKRNFSWGEDYANTILMLLERESDLFISADLDIGTIGYLNLVAGVRSDIEVYNIYGVFFGNRLFPPLKITTDGQIKKLKEFISNKKDKNKVYFITSRFEDIPREDLFLLFKYHKLVDGRKYKLRIPGEFLEFIQLTFQNDESFNDPWFEIHRKALIKKMGFFIGNNPEGMKGLLGDSFDEINKTIESELVGRLGRASGCVNSPNCNFTATIKELQKFSKDLSYMDSERLDLKEISQIYYLLGRCIESIGNKAGAKQYYIDSIEVWPSHKNMAYKRL